MAGVIVALDFAEAESALRLVSQLGESCRFYKVGSGGSELRSIRGDGPHISRR